MSKNPSSISLQISLYPIRVEAYLSTFSYPFPEYYLETFQQMSLNSNLTKKIFLRKYYSRKFSLEYIIKTLKLHFKIQNDNVKVWVREINVENSASSVLPSHFDSESTSTSSPSSSSTSSSASSTNLEESLSSSDFEILCDDPPIKKKRHGRSRSSSENNIDRIDEYPPKNKKYKENIDENDNEGKELHEKFKESSLDSASSSTSTSSSRLLTSKKLLWDLSHQWRLYEESTDISIDEFLGSRPYLQLIIEAPDSSASNTAGPLDWPRAGLIYRWLLNLRENDWVDLLDTNGKWEEAIVLKVNSPFYSTTSSNFPPYTRQSITPSPTSISLPRSKSFTSFLDHFKDLEVEFMILSTKEKVKIKDTRLIQRISPLHQYTPSRFGWKIGSEVRYYPDSFASSRSNFINNDDDDDEKEIEDEKVENINKKENEIKVSFYGEIIDVDTISEKFKIKRKVNTLNHDDILKSKVELISIYNKNLTLFTPTVSSSLSLSSIPNSSTSASTSTATNNISSTFKKFFSSSSSTYEIHTKGTPPQPGVVGLQNLGNTCFMNSILQCLSHTTTLTFDFFLSEKYKDEINYQNPLGNKGKIALEYGELLHLLWSGKYTKISPSKFKHTIGEFHSQFSGNEQQDSQEFLSFLLDGLHEDLNRIVKKPYVKNFQTKRKIKKEVDNNIEKERDNLENEESKNEILEEILPDEEIASESWRRYLLRNNSEIVDHCFGQLRSHVTCKNCHNESVTFDEFSCLSLPIPIAPPKYKLKFYFFPCNKNNTFSLPYYVELDIDLNLLMTDLKGTIVKEMERLGYNFAEHDKTTEENKRDDDFEIIPSVNYSNPSSDSPLSSSSSSSSSSSNSSSSETSDTSFLEKLEKIHLHFSISSSQNVSYIFKHYNTSEGISYTASQFIQNFTLIVYHLEFPADPPINKSYKPISTPSSASSLSSTTSSPSNFSSPTTTDSDGFVLVDNKKYLSIDLYLASTPSNLSNRIEYYGFPYRLSYCKDLSKEDLEEKILNLLKLYLIKKDEINQENEKNIGEIEDLKYTLFITTRNNTNMNSLKRIDDDFSLIKSLKQDEVLVIFYDKSNSSLTFKSSNLFIPLNSPQTLSSTSSPPLSIYSCLNKFTEREQLADTETIYCSKCKQHLPPIKKMDLWSCPDVLIIHLKRFQFSSRNNRIIREKIQQFVDFPLEGLDLSPYIKSSLSPEDAIYDLYAVSHHTGVLGGGHYVSSCLHPKTKTWYTFNDGLVSTATSTSILSPSAYVLFYKRRNREIKWGGSVPHPVGLPDEE